MPISSDDLHAYVDGNLPEERIAEIEAYLKEHPEEAMRVADYRLINQALVQSTDDVIAEPIPPRLLAVSRRRRFAPLRVAAAAAWLAVGLGGGWALNDIVRSGADPLAGLAQDATTAYAVFAPETRHPIEVAAAEATHLSAWLSNRLGMSVPIPSLSDLGLTLVGGRLLAGEQGPAALLMYQSGDGRRMVLYISNETTFGHETGLEFRRAGNASVVSWARDNAGFGLAGGFSEAELVPAAQLVKAQFSL